MRMIATQPISLLPWRTLLRLFFLLFLLITCRTNSQAGELDDAENLLKQKKFTEATAVLTDAVVANAKAPDFARYLRARSQFQAKRFADSIKDCELIPKESKWYYKSIFLKAENFIALKQHDEVEAIYRAESGRLSAQGRKESLARLLIDFANELKALGADESTISEEKAKKALLLLGKALEVETSPDIREEIYFSKITLLRDTGKSWQEVQSACNDYLAKFDSVWTEPLGRGKPRGRDNEFEGKNGKNLWAVRTILFKNMLSHSGQQAMRSYARKVLKNAPDKGEIEWMITQSYRRGATVRKDRYLEQLGDFLKTYQNHSRSAEAAMTLARYLKGDASITAFQSFLKRENWPEPTVEGKSKITPLARLTEWREEASFQIAQIQFNSGDYPGAIKQWQQYSQDFASSSRWATVQSRIVTSEFQACLDPVYSNNEAEARKRFAAFMAKYPLDDRVPQLLFLLGEFSFARFSDLHKDGKPEAQWKAAAEKAISDWSALIAKYSDTYEAKLAIYRTGSLQSGPLGEFEKGIETLKKLGENPSTDQNPNGMNLPANASQGNGSLFGNGGPVGNQTVNSNARIGGGIQGQRADIQVIGNLVQRENHSFSLWHLAKQRISLLEDKSLSLGTERIFRTNEVAQVLLQTRNIEKITISKYNLDLERYFRSHHRFDTEQGIESLDIDLIQPDETHTINIKDFSKHKLNEEKFPINFPENKPGVCIVRAEAEGWQASTIVLRSSIDLIAEATWREALVFASDSLTREKIEGARVLVTNGKELIGQGLTDKNGIFRLKGQMIRDSANLCFYVSAKQGEAMKRLNLSGMTQEITGGETKDHYAILSQKGYLYTGKDIYQAGETVNMRGVLRNVNDGEYVVQTDAKVVVKLLDPNNRTAREWNLELSKFGTFQLSFPLPPKISGNFIVRAKLEKPGADTYATKFMVRDADEPEEVTELTIKLNSQSVLPGEKIEGKLVARYSWGDPIVDEIVEIEFPDGHKKEFKTDENGEVIIEQATDDLSPGKKQYFQAKLVHLSGSVREWVFIQEAAFLVEWNRWPEVTLAGETLRFGLRVVSESDDPIAQVLDFVVEKLPPENEHTVLAGLPTVHYVPKQKNAVQVFQKKMVSDAEDGLAEIEVKLEKPGRYRVIISGNDHSGNAVRMTRNLNVGGKKGDSKLRILADDALVKEGDSLKLNVHSEVESPLALLTVAGATVIENRPLKLKKGHNELLIPVEAGHWPKFDVTVAFLHDGKLERARRSFTVERKLEIEITAPDKAIQPGDEVEFSISTNDSQGRPVSAEVSLALSGRETDHIHSFLEMFARGQRPGTSFRFGSTAAFQYQARSRFASPDLDENDSAQPSESHRQKLNTLVDQEKHLCASFPSSLIGVSDLAGARIINKIVENHSPSYLWSGPVVTGEDGRAVVKVRIPNSAGEWRMSAIGCDSARLLGQTSLTIESQTPVEMSLNVPVDIRAGDIWHPSVSVNMNDGEKKTLSLICKIGDKTTAQKMEVRPGRTQKVFFEPFEVTAPGPISWSVRLNEKTLNALVAVRPRNITLESNAAIFVRGQGGKFGPAMKGGHFGLSFYSSPSAFLADLARGKVPEIPGIDRESQTNASALLAATSALKLARAQNIKVPELESRIKTLILALQVNQVDGGWSWQGVKWQRDSLTTTLGLWGLREAEDLGFFVNGETVKSGIKYLTEVLAIIPPDEPEKTAMVLFALALENAENFSIANRLHRDREKLNPAALSFLAATFLRMERPTEAKQLLEVLLARTEDDSWPGSERVARLSRDGDISAMALYSLAKVKSPEQERIAIALLNSGGCQFGAQSACQGLWIAAMAEHFANQAVKKDTENSIDLKLNGKDWLTLDSENSQSVKFSSEQNNQISFGAAEGILLLTRAEENEGDLISKDGRADLLPVITSRNYYRSNLKHGDGYLSSKSSSPVSNVEIGKIIRVEIDFKHSEKTYRSFIEIDEPIPAGCLFLPGSLSAGHAKFEQSGNVLRITSLPGWDGRVSYSLVAMRPGTYSVPATIIRDECRSSRFRAGESTTLTVLSPGKVTQDKYSFNARERYEIARKFFDEGAYDNSLLYLEALEKHHAKDPAIRQHEREISRMLLWIHTTRPDIDAKKVVERFEALSERHSDVIIPFDKIRKVAEAYRSLGEMERSWLVYRAMVESEFINDAKVAMTLKEQGDFFGYQKSQVNLWTEYPDVQDVLMSYFTIAQDLEEKSHEIKTLTLRKGQETPTREQLLQQSRDLFERYLTFFPDNEQADAAAFNLANVFFDLKDYSKVASRSETAAITYPESKLLSTFQYMAALGNFWQYQFPEALKAADPVAAGRTENAPNARYIIAQIHQAQGNVVEAIDWYKKVRGEFPDAADSLAYLEEKGVKLPDPLTFHPGEDVSVELSYRNIRDADIQIYKVDLMRLYSRQKQMTDIAKVALAGISPELEMSVALGDGKDFEWRSRELKLPIKDVGAYLLVCRGDSTFASGLVIVTPLELKIRENAEKGDIRLHLWDSEKKSYVADAEIKAFDKLGSRAQKGRTDPRGVFQAGGITGRVAVVVKHDDTRYAYYRSANPLLPMPNVPTATSPVSGQNVPAAIMPRSAAKPGAGGRAAYMFQLKGKLKAGNKAQKAIWSEKLQKAEKGVKASKAFKH